MKRIVRTALCAALLFSSALTPALARQAAPPVVRAPQAVAPATPGEPSEKALGYARRYAKAMNFEKTVGQLMQTIIPMAVDAELGRRPELTEANRQVVREVVAESSLAITPKFVEAMIDRFAVVYSEQELLALAEFYESEIGRSIVAKEDLASKAGQETATDILPAFLLDLEKRLCARIDCNSPSGQPT